MPNLRYTKAAQRNLVEIAGYIGRTSGSRGIAKGFVLQLRGRCRQLASLDGMLGQARPDIGPDVRTFAFKGYLILFRYRGNMFEVLNVFEGHMDISRHYRDDDA